MRERLLDATAQCLAELGFAATTTTEVVRRAGVSRGAQVHHFPTKNELVVAALEHVFRLRQAEFRAAFSALAPEERRLATALDVIWAMYQTPAFTAWLELAVAARTDLDLRARFVAVSDRYNEAVEAIFEEFYPASPDGAFSRVAVQFAFALLDGLAVQRSVGINVDGEAVLEMLKGLATLFSPDIGGLS